MPKKRNHTPREKIEATKCFREQARPVECTHQDPCWVDEPFEAISRAATYRAYCTTCGGVIRTLKTRSYRSRG